MATVQDDYRPLEALRPHPKNYNRHSDRQVSSLSEAMRIVAYTAPVICRPDGTILGGHLRSLALRRLREEGYPEPEGVQAGWLVPCRVVECSEIEERKILVTDNPDPAGLDYDAEALTALLADLQSRDSLDGTWYDAARLDELIGELAGETAREPEEAGVEAVPEQWMVIVECDGEAQQTELLDRLTEEGYSCRALLS